MTCFNCSCPEGAATDPGRQIVVTGDRRYGDKRPRKCTVWCCSDECAIQALGISKYGRKTSAWPITLDQFRALKPLSRLDDAKPEKKRRQE
jgi:hypothetical protein